MLDAQAAAALGVGCAGAVPAVTLVMPASVHSPAPVASFGVAEGEERVTERVLASPALTVKAGRDRGLSVLARRRKAEAEQNAAEEVASSYELADKSLPNGVGILGRGRAAVNMPLRADGDGVQALQDAASRGPP